MNHTMNRQRKIYVATLSFSLVILLSAFGCKTNEDTTDAANVNTEPDTKAVFNVPEIDTGTNNANTVAAPEEASTENDATASIPDEGKNVETNTTGTAETKDLESEEIVLAEKIVEIFGSFTNKSREPFKNITDMEVYATTSLQPFLNASKQKDIDIDAAFYGVTTKVLSVAVLSTNANSTEMLITTERDEVTEDSQTGKKSYALIKVDMVKVNDEWKVNGLYWQ